MKTLVNSLATAVRKLPWVVVAVTIAVSLVLGNLGSKFVPSEDQNESFAPDAAELTAAERIGDLFGGTASRMQVMTSSSTGDVITLDGLLAANALDQSVRSGPAGEFLVKDTPQSFAILSYLAPVQFAIQGGAPMPTSDAEVKALYTAGLEQIPPESRPFVTGLLSDDGDPNSATSELGLTAISYEGSDDFDELANRAKAVAESVALAEVPGTITLEPFSQELIFASGDDFQEEILRLFASAGLIILLVLATVFLVKPSYRKDRLLFVGGVAMMASAVAIVVAPALALVLPDLLPSSWADATLGSVLSIAAILYLVAFLMWTFTSKKLRRTTSDTVLTFITILLAIQWMSGYGYLRFEDQSQMAQILPILLIGLGVDYSIHMSTRYRQELSAGSSVDRSVSVAIRTVGIALVLATLTTAVGFLTNVTSAIPALAEFGELAAVGISFSFLLMLTFVPAVRQLLDRRAERRGRLDTEGLEGGEGRILPRIIGRTAVLPRQFAVATVIVALVLTGVGAFGMTKLSTKFSFLDFVPTTSPLRDTAVTLDQRFDFPETTSVLVQGDIAAGSAWNAMLASYLDAADVETVQSITTPNGLTFPTGNTFMGVMFQLLNPAPDNDQFDPELFNTALTVGFDQQRMVPDGADVSPMYDVAVANHPERLAGVLVQENGAYSAALFGFDTTAGEAGAERVATGLNAAFQPSRDAGLEAIATSNFIIGDLVVRTLRNSQVSSLLLTLGAALLLLVINFWFESRRPMLGVITTLPVVMVVLWVFGLMAAFGIPFGPITATISAIGIGVGIPYMIHVTHRYLEERAERADGDEAMERTLTFTGGALAGSAITTIAGFGILIISTTIPFRQFGFVIAYTILLATSAAVLVLPSMLALWDRFHRNRGDVTIDAYAVKAALGESD